jgi:DNA polymerase elongation subunit (family B)
MRKPRILIYDIETSPNEAYVWGKYDQNVIAFKEERSMLSFAYKWYGEKGQVKCITREGLGTDKILVVRLAHLIDQADVIVAHNGDRFDRTFLKTRMLRWGMNPLKMVCQVDTLKSAKNYFNFNGNSLNDICTYLKLGKKLPHEGIEMWLGCMRDESKHWKKMAQYNKHDVTLLEKVYKRLLPWIENHPNLRKALEPKARDTDACPSCFSKKIKKYGYRVTVQTAKQRWLCNRCGKNWTTKL